MITSVKQTSNKAKLKQLLTKTNKTVIEVVTWKSTLQKCHESLHLGAQTLCSPYALGDFTPTSMLDGKKNLVKQCLNILVLCRFHLHVSTNVRTK